MFTGRSLHPESSFLVAFIPVWRGKAAFRWWSIDLIHISVLAWDKYEIRNAVFSPLTVKGDRGDTLRSRLQHWKPPLDYTDVTENVYVLLQSLGIRRVMSPFKIKRAFRFSSKGHSDKGIKRFVLSVRISLLLAVQDEEFCFTCSFSPWER